MTSGWDLHTHLVPPTVLAAARLGTHGLALRDGQLTVGDAGRLPLGRLTEPGSLLEWVAEQHLDGAVVSVPPLLFRHDLTGTEATDWCDLVNTGLGDIVATGGGRLRALACVPLGDPPLAAAGAADLARHGGFGGLAVGTLPDGAGLADPALDPLWSVLSRCGAFVLVHPTQCPDPRLDRFYLANMLGNPYETGLAAAQLLFAGVTERHPEISFLLCHGGGVTAALVGRWQRGQDTGRPGVPATTRVRSAARRLLVDDLVHDPDALRLVEAVFGPDGVHVGSDWPFPMGSGQVDRGRASARAAAAEHLTRRYGY